MSPSCLWLGGVGREVGSVALGNDEDEFVDSPQLALLGECSSCMATVPVHIWAWSFEKASFPVSPRDSLKGLRITCWYVNTDLIKTIKTENPNMAYLGLSLIQQKDINSS